MKSFYFSIFILFSISLSSQSTIGLKAGFYHAEFFEKRESTSHYFAEYNSVHSYAYSFIYKGRKNKLINIGMSLDMQPKAAYMNIVTGGLGSQTYRDFKVSSWFLNFSIFPELILGKNFLFTFSAGPQIGRVLYGSTDGQYKIISMNSVQGPFEENKNSKEFAGFDLRAFANLGVEIPLNEKFRITIDGTYSYGFSNISQYRDEIKLNTKDYGIFAGISYRLDNFNFSNFFVPVD